MAAASPVVIPSSSPPPVTRSLSLTPPSAYPQNHESPVSSSSSSPRLLSPSVFVRPVSTFLKSGSRAQQVPAGASGGFASAARLWRSKYFTEEEQGGNDDAGTIKITEKTQASKQPRLDSNKKASTGQVIKPTKRVGELQATAINEETLAQTARKDAHMKPDTEGNCSRKRPHLNAAAEICESDAIPCGGRQQAECCPHAGTNLESAGTSDTNIESIKAVKGSRYKLDIDLGDASGLSKPKNKSSKTRTKPSAKSFPSNVSEKRLCRYNSEPIIIDSDELNLMEATLPGGNSDETKTAKTCFDALDNRKPVETSPDVVQRSNEFVTDVRQKSREGSVIANLQSPAGESCAFSETSVYFHDSEGFRDYGLPHSKSHEANSTNLTVAEALSKTEVPFVGVGRRRNWTPAKDTKAKDWPKADPKNGAPASPNLSAASLSRLACLGQFEYNKGCATSPKLALEIGTSEVPTKRRRVDLVDGLPTLDSTTNLTELAPQKLKRAKSPKKPQTITALATAAYQTLTEFENEAAILCSGPAQVSDALMATNAISNVAAEPTKKARQPRKPRTKTSSDKPQSKKSNTKSKKSISEAKSDRHIQQLYSPTQASAQLHHQAFIFGTSSQLAADESPEFIRDTQIATLVSEQSDIPSQVNNNFSLLQTHIATRRGKSSTRVPTAPHGTSLSVSQNERDLWCVAARGRDGGLFRQRPLLSNSVPPLKASVEANSCQSEIRNSSIATTSCIEDLSVNKSCELSDKNSNMKVAPSELTYGHIKTSLDDGLSLPSSNRIDSDRSVSRFAIKTQSNQTNDSETTAADDATHDQFRTDRNCVSTQTTADLSAKHQITHSQSLSATDAQRGLAVSGQRELRSPLRLLDVNAGVVMPFFITKSAPRNEHHAAIHTSTKTESASSKAMKRARGRPRKQRTVSAVTQSNPNESLEPSLGPNTTQQTILKASEAAGWLDIDEISDSDTPVTPSPPRRRSSYVSPTVQPLNLRSATKVNVCTESATQEPALKPGETSWSSISEGLFPRITAAVKSASRSTSSIERNQFSWWDKILLYDPIEVEELTTWLNDQGLTIQVSRKKPKTKSKKRKKKSDDKVNDDPDDDNAEIWELHEESLKPWMVQKWCEDNSICCLFKENVKHGWRKGRY